jgi:hypothetical protein
MGETNMPHFELLGALMRDLHQEFVRIYYLLLPVFFALAVVATWFRSPQGSIEFLDVFKRAMVSTFLLVAFPDISRAILFIADGITERIDSLNSLDTIVRMAQEKAQNYSMSPTSILLQFNDLIIATLSFLSYLVLYVARYLTIAMYHFFWIFFMISAPLLLLFNMFSSTSQITANLFRGLIEVASWKIVWAILGAMLSALSFGDAYRTEGNYLTLIVMNFVIATAMLATPMIVRSIVGSGLQSMSSSLGPVAVAAIAAAPARVATVAATSRNVISVGQSFAREKIANYIPKNH